MNTPKYQNSMLADAATREQLQKEFSGKQWKMKISSVNLDKHFCLLDHNDFLEKIYCPEIRISGNMPEAGANCVVTVEIAEHNGAFIFRAKTCRIQTGNQGRDFPTQKKPVQYQKQNNFQKSGKDYRQHTPSSPKNGKAAPEDFYHTREEFFKASRMGRDEALLVIYLNRAVTNFCTSCGIPPQDDFKPAKFAEKIQNLDFETLKKLAHFLFLFAVVPADYLTNDQDDSANSGDGKEKILRKICADFAGKLISLRNFFSHTDRQLGTELRLEDSIYRFLGKFSMEMSSKVKHDVHALANFPLTRRIVKNEGKRFVSYFELTKYGIVFLCCMALYKDEANRFCAQLTGLKKNDMFSDSMREFFTASSFPPHRQVFEQGNSEILMFADIINYLNKVPSVSLENLSLQSERKRLDALKSASQENADKKDSRYRLHERSGDKFAWYALNYLTDFKVLPNFTFRHLDTSESLERQKFSFAGFPDGLSPLDRRFIVDHDSVQFEWRVPDHQEHFGKIHIQALRGMMTDNMLKEILYLALDPADLKLGPQINGQLHHWLSAYHKFLERVLDRADDGQLPLKIEDYLPELQILSGKTQEEIRQDFSGSVKSVIGPSLTAFFEDQAHIGEEDLLTSLQRKVNAVLNQDLALEKRFQHEKLSDSLMIHLVFRFFNLHLEKTPWQFRQLHSEQHRGCLDYEYQTVHALIGKYTSDPKALWKHFQKMSEKAEKSKDFCTVTRLSAADACDYCRSRKMLLEKSKPLKRTSSLEDLAFAALKECIREEKNVLDRLDPVKNPARESLDLENWLTRYEIKQLKNYNTDDLFRSVLKINPGEWRNAYNSAEKCNYRNRPLSGSSFIVPQVNLPQNIFSELVSRPENLAKIQNNPRVRNPKTNQVDLSFGFGIRQITPPVRLRDFYDDSTLVQWLKDNSVSQPTMPVCSLRKNNVDKAFRNIRKVFARDKLLVLAALEYWKEYSKYSLRLKFTNEESDQPADVYDFFSRDITFPVVGRKIRIHLNDLNKPSFLQLTGSPDILNELFRSLQIAPADIPDFDTLRAEMNRIKDSDIRIQRRFIINILEFYDNAPNIPGQNRPENISKAEWENSLKYRKIAEALHAVGYAKERSVEEISKMIEFRNALLHDKFNLADKFQSLIERLEVESPKTR